MSDILEKIINRKTQEVLERKACQSISDLEKLIAQQDEPRGFVRAVTKKVAQKKPAVIAEIKKASPSKGVIREIFDPEEIARAYAANGASCLSILTDIDFFQGNDLYLRNARRVCELPVLRKDFMIDEYQIIESRAIGADCILLIVAGLEQTQLTKLYKLARSCHLDVLVEVHNHQELERALELDIELIGINNRNLKTFDTSLETTIELLDKIPSGKTVVTESGIHTRAHVDYMLSHGVFAFLVGEAFMRATYPGEELNKLFNLNEAE